MRETIPDRFLDARGEVAPLPDLERELIAFALKHYGGRMSKVARALKIGRSTLYRKLRDYGLEEGVESRRGLIAYSVSHKFPLRKGHIAGTQKGEELPALTLVV